MAPSSPSGYVPNLHHPEVMRGILEQVLATGKDPAIAANGEGVFVAWSGADGVMAKVPGSAEARRLDAEGGFPQLIALPGGTVLAAWERKGEIEFQRLSAGASRF